ncbi:MAG: hypothetical protein AMXMBFR47_42880 [Planctomycetota bacterium]
MPRKQTYAEIRDEKLAALRKNAARPERREQNTREFTRLMAEYGADPVALRDLAATLSIAGLLEDALKFLQDALQRLGPRPELLCGLADLLLESGRTREAMKCLVDAASAFPTELEPRRSLGRILLKTGRSAPAVEQYRAALASKPGDPECELGLGLALQSWGRFHLAIPRLLAAIAARPKSLDAAAALGTCFHRTGDYTAATGAFRKALAIERGLAVALAGEAAALAAGGRTGEAVERLKPLLRGDVAVPIATVLARIAGDAGFLDEAIRICERVLANPNHAAAPRAALAWSLGELYEQSGDVDRAFEAYSLAQRQGGDRGLSADSYRRFVDAAGATFSADALAALPRASIPTDLPVFIVGAPQSGTRLVECVLSSHPSIFAAGELRDVSDWMPELVARAGGKTEYPACLASLNAETIDQFSALQRRWYAELGGDAIRVTDANPMNYQHLGLIRQFLPGARVIHVERDPLDACFAWFTAPPGTSPSRTDLALIAAIHGQYRRLMTHWKSVLDLPILEVRYEDLVANPEAQTRRMIDFCGLPWDDACLRPHESKRLALTPDLDRLRRPIDASQAARAARFGAHLDPLRAALAQA